MLRGEGRCSKVSAGAMAWLEAKRTSPVPSLKQAAHLPGSIHDHHGDAFVLCSCPVMERFDHVIAGTSEATKL